MCRATELSRVFLRRMGHEAIMKFSLAACLLAAVSIPSWAAGVDAALLALVPPDTQVLAGIHVSQTESTPFGQYLISQVQLDPDAKRIMASIGFDPHRDLT